jgi:hypothetical protein
MATSPDDKKGERDVEVEDKRLELLMSYTVFHIGLYISLVAALIATEKGYQLFAPLSIRMAVVLLLAAGACGGTIAVNVAEFDVRENRISEFFAESGYSLRVWDAPNLLLNYRCLARVEHFFFWFAMVILLWSFLTTKKSEELTCYTANASCIQCCR